MWIQGGIGSSCLKLMPFKSSCKCCHCAQHLSPQQFIAEMWQKMWPYAPLNNFHLLLCCDCSNAPITRFTCFTCKFAIKDTVKGTGLRASSARRRLPRERRENKKLSYLPMGQRECLNQSLPEK